MLAQLYPGGPGLARQHRGQALADHHAAGPRTLGDHAAHHAIGKARQLDVHRPPDEQHGVVARAISARDLEPVVGDPDRGMDAGAHAQSRREQSADMLRDRKGCHTAPCDQRQHRVIPYQRLGHERAQRGAKAIDGLEPGAVELGHWRVGPDRAPHERQSGERGERRKPRRDERHVMDQSEAASPPQQPRQDQHLPDEVVAAHQTATGEQPRRTGHIDRHEQRAVTALEPLPVHAAPPPRDRIPAGAAGQHDRTRDSCRQQRPAPADLILAALSRLRGERDQRHPWPPCRQSHARASTASR